jgi:hypothetical protein
MGRAHEAANLIEQCNNSFSEINIAIIGIDGAPASNWVGIDFGSAGAAKTKLYRLGSCR